MEERLLALPPWPVMEDYYSSLTAGLGIGVKQSPDMGKGVFAQRDYDVDDVILIEPPLVAFQHSHNKSEAVVCSFCFCYIGSIRLQIQHKLEARTSACCGEECSLSPEEALNLVTQDGFSLPYEETFQLPDVVNCPRGCSDMYCSVSCAEQAWEAYHFLLCTGAAQRKEELVLFRQLCDGTNDIFLLASQAIANVMLRAKRMSVERGSVINDDLLLEAWKPLAMGKKLLWWETMALPEDVPLSEESEFRCQMKDLAGDALCLLRAAIYEEEFASLFSLEVFGSIIGMFELNNLEVVVESPVENYFLFLDDLQPELKDEAEKVTRPLLDVLGDRYASFCEGSGFFALQSCMNHSCLPNVKAFKRAEDINGNAVIIAVRKIKNGEQLFTSYIDSDSSLQERQLMLADYGFVCQCPRCVEESSS